jgi:hypothetical protein
MAVVGIAHEAPNSPSGKISRDQRTFTRTFIVEVNSAFDGPAVVYGAIGLPRVWQLYVTPNESDLYARCRTVTPKRVANNSYLWTVECEYETPDEKQVIKEQQGSADNPLLDLPQISLTHESYQAPCRYAIRTTDGKVVNVRTSADEELSPLPKRDESRTVLTITRNEDISTPIAATSQTYLDVINSDVFWGAGAHTAKIKAISASREVKNTTALVPIIYLKCTYVIEFRRDPTGGTGPAVFNTGWDISILDSGYKYKDAATGKILNFLTDNGQPTRGLLDGTGHKQTALDPGDPNGIQLKPVYSAALQIYVEMPFAALNLPQSFIPGF